MPVRRCWILIALLLLPLSAGADDDVRDRLLPLLGLWDVLTYDDSGDYHIYLSLDLLLESDNYPGDLVVEGTDSMGYHATAWWDPSTKQYKLLQRRALTEWRYTFTIDNARAAGTVYYYDTFTHEQLGFAPFSATRLISYTLLCPIYELLPDFPELQTLLRTARDTVLSQSAAGRTLISWYYQLAPGLSRLLADNPDLAAAVRQLAAAATQLLSDRGIDPAVLY